VKTNYAIGDKVSFLNEDETGIITELTRYRATVRKESGFEVSVSVNELVPLLNESLYTVDVRRITEKEINQPAPKKTKINEVWEVDLHLSEILDTGRMKTDHEKLLAQLNYFHKCMNAAILNKIKKVIFIHGVGKGTLKQEIHHSLRQYNRVRHYDAPFKKYGFGGTTVEWY
jgi:dsDNA-specific endonuclease/ATPase MutS2